jgi:hypothetical protein
MSMPNLRKAGGGAAPFVPVTLVQENWAGSGVVDGRTPVPTSGGGTWQVNPLGSGANYSAGSATPNGDFCQIWYSLTNTSLRFETVPYPGTAGSSNVGVSINARSNSTTNPTSVYQTTFNVGNVTLRKFVLGVDTILASVDTDPTGLPVVMQISGSVIKVFVNLVEIASVTDTSISGSGYWGFTIGRTSYGEDIADSTIGPITIKTA